MWEQKKGRPRRNGIYSLLYSTFYFVSEFTVTVYCVPGTLNITGMFRKLNHLVKIQFSDKTDSILVIYLKFWLFRLFNILTCIASFNLPSTSTAITCGTKINFYFLSIFSNKSPWW